MKEIEIGDCVNIKYGEYLGRVVSIEKGVAKVRLLSTGELVKYPVDELFRTHI